MASDDGACLRGKKKLKLWSSFKSLDFCFLDQKKKDGSRVFCGESNGSIFKVVEVKLKTGKIVENRLKVSKKKRVF